MGWVHEYRISSLGGVMKDLVMEKVGQMFGFPIFRVQELLSHPAYLQRRSIFDPLNKHDLGFNDKEKTLMAIVCFYTFPPSENFPSQEEYLEEYTRLKVYILTHQCQIPKLYRDDILGDIEGRY